MCMLGMGTKMYDTCGKLLLKILRICVPDDMTEEGNNIQEMMTCHENEFETLWYIVKVVAKIMNPYRALTLSKYKGSISRHAGVWDVYRMIVHHQGTVFKAQDCSIGFLRDIIDPGFSAAVKMELGMLTG